MPSVLTLTFNPAVDLAVEVPALVPGHKMRCGTPQVDPGGGGINVARVLRRLGVDVVACHTQGGPTGQRLGQLLERDGLARRVVPIADETRENLAVTESSTGRQFRFVLPGPRLATAEWEACVAAALQPPAPGWIVASGSLPAGVPGDVFARLSRGARAAGALLAVDVAGLALRWALEAGVSLVKPSLRELREATGDPLDTPDGQLAACRRLVRDGSAAAVALSLGEAGAIYACAQGSWRATAPAVQARGSIGAGDCFLAALVHGLATGLPPPEALARGVAAGSASLLGTGTSLCWPDEIARLRRDVDVVSLDAAIAGACP